MDTPQELRRRIAAHLDLGVLAPDQQERLIETLETHLAQKLSTEILKILPTEQQRELADLDDELLPQYLSAHIPDFKTFAEKRATEIVDEFLELRKKYS